MAKDREAHVATGNHLSMEHVWQDAGCLFAHSATAHEYN